MSRIFVFALFGLLVMNSSCEKCKRCRYSYTETKIVVTPDGEIEEKIEHTNLILLDADNEPYGDECLKYKEYKDKTTPFSIENYYLLEAETTTLDNYQYTCVDL